MAPRISPPPAQRHANEYQRLRSLAATRVQAGRDGARRWERICSIAQTYVFLSCPPRSTRKVSVEHEMENLALALRPARRQVAFGAKNIAVEIGHPLPTA